MCAIRGFSLPFDWLGRPTPPVPTAQGVLVCPVQRPRGIFVLPLQAVTALRLVRPGSYLRHREPLAGVIAYVIVHDCLTQELHSSVRQSAASSSALCEQPPTSRTGRETFPGASRSPKRLHISIGLGPDDALASGTARGRGSRKQDPRRHIPGLSYPGFQTTRGHCTAVAREAQVRGGSRPAQSPTVSCGAVKGRQALR